MNLKLSKRGDYVVRWAIYLARAHESGVPRKLRQVAAEMGIPRTFVSQILGDLVHAGLAVPSFGRDGGYRLARPPEEITLLELVEAGEGPLVAETCTLGEGPCDSGAFCPLHERWSAATAALRSELVSASLADVAQPAAPAGDDTGWPADAQWPALTVSLADSIQIELASAAVAARLRAGGSWLTPHVEAASAEHETTRLRVGPGGPSWLGKTVAVRLGQPEGTDEALVIPVGWAATGPTGLFPRFDGELGLRAIDAERTELTLSGRYRPPFGRAGQVLDETVLARVASATVRSFLRRVAHTLEEQTSPPDVPPDQGGSAIEPPAEPALVTQ